MELRPGDQVPVDGTVVDAEGLELDEALLTGESEPVDKAVGDEVRSGSFVVAGTGRCHAVRVGRDVYARRLAEEARRFDLVRSDLRAGIDRILRWVTWIMIPAAGLLVASQFLWHAGIAEAIRSSVAGIGAMVPEGLVLLTSMAFAVGVIRLGRRRVLVQELAAIEGLARVDVVCLDKTGTLTEAEAVVGEVDVFLSGGEVDGALGAFAAADDAPNATMRAIGAAYEPPAGWAASGRVPFSSARKWSAVDFGNRGTWVLGAADVLAPHVRSSPSVATLVDRRIAEGRRVLLLVRGSGGLTGEELPGALEPAAVVSVEEQVRADAPATLTYLADEGVAVKVISGDDPRTVASVAHRVGLAVQGDPFDGRQLPVDPEALARIVETHNVFGRVTPEQKRAMVQALRASGHVVAMTGDGVNDVLALKDADIGVAMGSGSAASRSVARLVLLDNSFAALPSVLAEGRRVIANIERVAKLFVTKTVYALLLALAVGVARLPFPFYPRHLTVISTLTIGVPAFFLALAPNTTRARPGFEGRVLRFAAPAGLVAAAATFVGYNVARAEAGVTLSEARTVATIVLFLIGLDVLAILARPFTRARVGLLALMVAGFSTVLAIGGFRSFFALDFPEPAVLLTAAAVAAVADLALEAGWRLAGRWGSRNGPGSRIHAATNSLDVSFDQDGDERRDGDLGRRRAGRTSPGG
jgi:cation-transporting ATPase E